MAVFSWRAAIFSATGLPQDRAVRTTPDSSKKSASLEALETRRQAGPSGRHLHHRSSLLASHQLYSRPAGLSCWSELSSATDQCTGYSQFALRGVFTDRPVAVEVFVQTIYMRRARGTSRPNVKGLHHTVARPRA